MKNKEFDSYGNEIVDKFSCTVCGETLLTVRDKERSEQSVKDIDLENNNA